MQLFSHLCIFIVNVSGLTEMPKNENPFLTQILKDNFLLIELLLFFFLSKKSK